MTRFGTLQAPGGDLLREEPRDARRLQRAGLGVKRLADGRPVPFAMLVGLPGSSALGRPALRTGLPRGAGQVYLAGRWTVAGAAARDVPARPGSGRIL